MRTSFGLDAGTDDDRGNDNDEQVFVFICHYPYRMDPGSGTEMETFGNTRTRQDSTGTFLAGWHSSSSINWILILILGNSRLHRVKLFNFVNCLGPCLGHSQALHEMDNGGTVTENSKRGLF
jgi:hypothetical protein